MPILGQLTSFLFTSYQLTTEIPESESQLLYDWRITANQFVLTPSPLTQPAIFFN
jgi:hypothetical protein